MKISQVGTTAYFELRALKQSFSLWFFLFFLFTIIFLTVHVPHITFHLYQPFISADQSIQHSTIVKTVFRTFKHDLLPQNTELIATNPLTSFLVEVKIALLLSFSVLSPYLLYCLLRYLSPALFPHEKKRLTRLSTILAILLLSGFIFAYHFLIRPMFEVLLSFNFDSEVRIYLLVDEFISWVLSTLIIVATLFLLPLFMYLLTKVNLVQKKIWRVRWKEAFMVFLILSAIITPDASGVSILILSLPMIFLYSVGIVASERLI